MPSTLMDLVSPCRIRVFLHGFAAEFDGQLTEHTVATSWRRASSMSCSP